jgi:Flp pilus assembly pilin Flp
MRRRETSGREELRRNRKGAVSTEYVVIVGTMGLVVAFAIVKMGPRLLEDFRTTRGVIMSPVP